MIPDGLPVDTLRLRQPLGSGELSISVGETAGQKAFCCVLDILCPLIKNPTCTGESVRVVVRCSAESSVSICIGRISRNIDGQANWRV
jgi:hypothetical protein